jgi:hypothetical protein
VTALSVLQRKTQQVGPFPAFKLFVFVCTFYDDKFLTILIKMSMVIDQVPLLARARLAVKAEIDIYDFFYLA